MAERFSHLQFINLGGGCKSHAAGLSNGGIFLGPY